jgi:hypothetical protein
VYLYDLPPNRNISNQCRYDIPPTAHISVIDGNQGQYVCVEVHRFSLDNIFPAVPHLMYILELTCTVSMRQHSNLWLQRPAQLPGLTFGYSSSANNKFLINIYNSSEDPHDPRLEMTAVQRFVTNVEGKGSLGKEKTKLVAHK